MTQFDDFLRRFAASPEPDGVHVRAVKRESEIRFKTHEIKADDVGSDGTFAGYGAVYGNVDSHGDIIEPGAFAESLAQWEKLDRPVPCLWNHRDAEPIGKFTSVLEDDKGLKVEGQLLVNLLDRAREVHGMVKERIVTGMSIGYRVFPKGSTWDFDEDIRYLTNLKLEEISLVVFPSNDEARTEEMKMKLRGGDLPSPREFEKHLRDLGVSKSRAVSIVNHGLLETLRREAGESDEAKHHVEEMLRSAAKFDLSEIKQG